MITIKYLPTGETFKYYNANKEFATKDSFCTNTRLGRVARSNLHAVAYCFLDLGRSTQVILKENCEVVL